MPSALRAEWERDAHSITWRSGTNIVWRFCYDTNRAKPFFHPLAGADGVALTEAQPADHPWHHGLWFSWKYVNRANYWEEDRNTGRAQGRTVWSTPEIESQPDGRAIIRMDLSYIHPSGRVDLTERRELTISSPDRSGGSTIDWTARFTAGKEGAVLDRTPMPGEPNGQVNGGYAGLGLRLSSLPFQISIVCSTGAVTRFESDRARPFAPALACNLSDGSRALGGIAIFSDPSNAGLDAPWYVANSPKMRFLCAAILAPRIRELPPGGTMDLRYRIGVRPEAWTVDALRAAQDEWLH